MHKSFKKVLKKIERRNTVVGEQLIVPEGFDLDFYRSFYKDLSSLSPQDLIIHWENYGHKEGRLGTLEGAMRKFSINPYEFDEDVVDADFYLNLYPDLVLNGVETPLQAVLHYFSDGQKEKRVPSLKIWIKQQDFDSDNFDPFFLESIIKQNADKSLKTILDIISAENVLPISLAQSPIQTANIYFELAKNHLEVGRHKQGKSLLKISISFAPLAKSFELLGNLYLDDGYFHAALKCYNQALELDPSNYWAFRNAIGALAKFKRFSDVMSYFDKFWEHQANRTELLDLFDEVAHQYFDYISSLASVDCDLETREHLLTRYHDYAVELYSLYQRTLDVEETPQLKQINDNKILIVGDHHVPQCIRYRIDQKVEQLELQGKEVVTVDWLDLDKEWNQLALHDIVIFYRVPAVPMVLKAMAQTNSVGKLSIYEIDDLLFDTAYPPPLETYGGYVDLHVYHELMKGAGLFNAAAYFCRIGLASTLPLVRSLKERVKEKVCILHRNGLDSFNEFRVTDKSQKNTVDIFYGSGTQAHNSDFIEQVLPALEKVLSERANVRLIIVGYLSLPDTFLAQFKKQVRLIPPVKEVQNYWSLLEQADINIAVLHEDKITNAKSELKWFEAACFAIPSVLSSTENYRDVICDGEDALLVTSSEEWYRALVGLIDNPEKRRTMGIAALERIKEEYSLEALGKQLVTQLDGYIDAIVKPKSRKKLLLVNVFFAPQSIGGATRVVEDNLDVMLEQYAEEYDITVFTADANCRRDSHRLTSYKYKGINVYRVTTLWREHMDWHSKDSEMYDLFTEFLQNEQPDLVHFHCVQRLTASIVEATRDMNIPYFVTVHDAWWISDYQFLVDEKENVYPEGHPDPYEPIPVPTNITVDQSLDRRLYLKGLLNDAQKAFVVSECFADIYRKNGVHNVVVTKNGLSEKIQWLPKDTSYTDKVVCALIGGMSAHKGYEILKAAIKEAQPQNCEFIFVDHAQESGYEKHEMWGEVPITFVGREKQREIVNLYRKIDVLFAPSIWPESFGLVTREAAACGCWVVASSLGGIGEDVIDGEGGYVIEPIQQALVEILQKIEQQPQKYKQLAKSLPYKPVSQQVAEIVEFYS